MRALYVYAVIVTVGIAGCGQPTASSSLSRKLGTNCVIQFRRGDGLGAGGGNPVPPTTSNMNGADVTVSGKLTSVSDLWVGLHQDKREYFIPRDAILLIDFNN